MTIQDDVLLTWYDSVVELFELDLTPVTTGVTNNKFYFTNQTTTSGTKIQWKGSDNGTTLVTYEPLPIAADGFEKTTKGQIPQPTLTVANIFGTFTEALGDLDDLVGARVTRRRTLAKYLGGMPQQNLNAEFPPDKFFIERKTAETNQFITFQLASPLDLEGLQLPKRIITQNHCLWEYRGAECGYAGPPVANVYDGPPTPVSGTTDSASTAYLQAVSGLTAAQTAFNSAQAAYNIAVATASGACDPATVGFDSTVFKYDERPSFVSIDGLTFAMLNGDEVLLLMWDGAVKGPGNTRYIPTDRNANTTYGNNSSGPLRAITEQVTVSGTPVEYFDISTRSGAKFAFTDQDGGAHGIWNGQLVSLSGTGYPRYRSGPVRDSDGVRPMRFVGEVDIDNSACTNATTARDNAQAALTTASGVLATATATYNAALAALPSGSVVRSADVCGKRVTSCRLRYPTGPLPFGGFPGANLVR